jgi:hypothetical protein
VAEYLKEESGQLPRPADVTAFGREVAVKVLLDKYAAASSVARRFQVNDNVRIRLETMSTPMRERRKSEFGLNLNAIHFTPEVYTVTNVRNFPGIRPPEYNVADPAGNVIQSGATPKRFFGSDLLHVPAVNVNPSIHPASTQRANTLNRLRN